MRRIFLPALTALALSGCAIGGAPAPEATPYAPSFAPAPVGGEPAGSAGDEDDGADPGGRDRRDRGERRDGDRGTAATRDEDRDRGVDGAVGSGDGPGAAAPPTVTSARVSDPTGDVSGIEPPDWSDLVAAELRREATGWTLVLGMAGTVPAGTTGDRVLDLTLWVDRDGDGAVDDEVLAQLGEDGWTTAYRDPDRARYGPGSGVEARSDGSEVVVTMPPGHLGGVERLQWAVSAELGTLTAMTTGTASRDAAPGQGAASFPG